MADCDAALIWGTSGVGEDYVSASSWYTDFQPSYARLDKRYVLDPEEEAIWKAYSSSEQVYTVCPCLNQIFIN